MKLTYYKGEPCGLGNFPESGVLSPERCPHNFPINIALSINRKTMLLTDSCDHYQDNNITKKEALEILNWLANLINEME